jgi:peptidoglycan/LPS O-acetylase OafA/YrhL
MLFREFNSERGTWASQFEAVLLFCAYLTFAFLFSLLITLTIETPCHRLYKEFIKNEKMFVPEAKASRDSMIEDDYNLG